MGRWFQGIQRDGFAASWSARPVKFGEIVERIDLAKLARVDQAHVEIAHAGVVLRLEEEGVFAMQDCLFERLSTIASLLRMFITIAAGLVGHFAGGRCQFKGSWR